MNTALSRYCPDIFNWHDIEEQGFYHSNGNYESGCTTVPAEDIENKHAIVIGAGIGGLAAACFLVRDAKMPGENITVYEARSVSGGSCDGTFMPGSWEGRPGAAMSSSWTNASS